MARCPCSPCGVADHALPRQAPRRRDHAAPENNANALLGRTVHWESLQVFPCRQPNSTVCLARLARSYCGEVARAEDAVSSSSSTETRSG
eukprot:9491719-Pyramimonas_sp.AAC.1